MTGEQFKIIKFPLVTEKSNEAVAENKYAFCVNSKSGKIQIKKETGEKVDIVVMIQGDEPMIYPEMINKSSFFSSRE